MEHRDLISGIFWLAVGVLLSISASRYTIGGITEPGPGFLPLILGILLIFLSLIVLFGAKKSSTTEKGSSFSPGGGWKKVGFTVLVLIVLAFFFEKVGYLITFFLLILFLMAGAGGQSWKRILLVALLSAVGVYIVFVLFLEQPLPRGILRL